MDIIDQVKAAQRAGSKFGTGRAAELLDRLGRPDEKLKIVHVAGSNGKGSVCAYVTAALVCAGRRTGTFTSPEVYSYEEQFCIDGRPAARAVIRRYLAAAEDAARGMSDAPSAFELETCAALAMFAGEGCEYCVLECGLGGLCDATNAVSRKEVALITSISREHTAVLGDDIADICRHKAGIIKNCPALVPANLCAEAARYFSSLGAATSKCSAVPAGGRAFGAAAEDISSACPATNRSTTPRWPSAAPASSGSRGGPSRAVWPAQRCRGGWSA